MPNLIIGQPKVIKTDLNQKIPEEESPDKKGIEEYNQLAQRVMSQYDKKFTLYNLGPSTGTLRSNHSLMMPQSAVQKDKSPSPKKPNKNSDDEGNEKDEEDIEKNKKEEP